MRIRIPANGWKPRPHQQRLWNYLEGGGRHAVAVWHRRAGKDEIALHRTCVAAHERPATYWHMLPEAEQARKAIWNAVNPHTGIRRIDEAFPVELRANTNDQQMFIRFKCNATWQVVGSDNFNSLLGSPPVGIVYSEWSLAKPAAPAFLRPILAENKGWEIYIYTPRGRNHGLRTYESAKRNPSHFAELLTVDDTGTIGKKDLENARREAVDLYGPDQGEAYFRQEYFCEFQAALLGAYFGRELVACERAGRIRQVDHDANAAVFTAWDIGYRDDTAIWFYQVVRDEIHVIDYHASSGQTIEHYAKLVTGKPYRYARHWLPHDAKAKTLASGGKSIIEQLAGGLGLGKLAIVPNLELQDGIQAARLALSRTWFDEGRCGEGLEALRQYQREWDEDKKAFRERPRHDWTSHPADAFRMLAVAWRAEAPVSVPEPSRALVVGGPSTYTVDDMWKDHEASINRRQRI